MAWFVYIIECEDGTYYTGLSENLDQRFQDHRKGKGARYTKRHGVKQVVYSEKYDKISDARNREVQLKNWSQRKKEKLIKGIWSYQGNSR